MAPVPLVGRGVRLINLGERDGPRNVGLFCSVFDFFIMRGSRLIISVINRGSSKDGYLWLSMTSPW